jgi:hypothetical protein
METLLFLWLIGLPFTLFSLMLLHDMLHPQ